MSEATPALDDARVGATAFHAEATAPVEFAGFGLRVAAALIDTVWQAALSAALLALGFWIVDTVVAGPWGVQERAKDNMTTAVQVLLGFVLPAVFVASRWAGTPGKRVLHLAVVRPDGAPVGFLRALLREIARILDVATLGVGCLMVLWTAERTALHDLLADTRVVRRRR